MPVASAQSRQQVLELRELDLGARLPGPRVQREDVEDQPRAVDHPHSVAPRLLEVAHLAGRELVVEDHEARPLLARGLADLLDRALADVRGGVRRDPLLDESPDDLAAGRVHETLQLVEVILGDRPGNPLGGDAD